MEELLANVEVVPMASHRQPRRRMERVHDDRLRRRVHDGLIIIKF
jgi:hypothetical protein